MAAWYPIVSEGKGPLPLDRIGNVGRLAALGSWRVTQGVYRFDQDLYEAVRGTPLEGDLPAAARTSAGPTGTPTASGQDDRRSASTGSPPIPVNVEDLSGLPAVVHLVEQDYSP